jgi:hypothetical protein
MLLHAVDSCTHLETCLKVEQRECDASGSRLICILPVSECYDENIAQSGPNGGFSLCVTGEPGKLDDLSLGIHFQMATKVLKDGLTSQAQLWESNLHSCTA